MKNRQLWHFLGGLFNFVFVASLLAVVAVKVHWSIALLCGWMAISISGNVSMMNRLRRAVKAIDQQQRGMINQLNLGAKELEKEMNTCRECEVHGKHGIRPGSIHNRRAPNCLMAFKKEGANEQSS